MFQTENTKTLDPKFESKQETNLMKNNISTHLSCLKQEMSW